VAHADATDEAERRAHGTTGPTSDLTLEIVEGALLAIVAVMTAWSSYQSALWQSKSAVSYAQAAALRSSAQKAETLAGQQMLYDATSFDAWLSATDAHNTTLAGFLERRFRPEYMPAFQAWLATDPFHNPSAPPGPGLMPEYRNASAEKAASLEQQATAALDTGKRSSDVSDQFVRATVFLAVVLFLTALSQRFAIRQIRFSMLVLALSALGYSVYLLESIRG
jgi:hypothetical protein